MMLFSVKILYQLQEFTVYSYFIINVGWVSSNFCLCSLRSSYGCFGVLLFLLMCIIIVDFQILNQSYIPGINSTWLWCISLFICCKIQLANILLQIFTSVFMRNIGLYFFLVLALSNFSIRVILASWNELEHFLSPSIKNNTFINVLSS